MPCRANLVAVYGRESGRGVLAETLPILMMRPPCGVWLFMILTASRLHRNAAVRFTSRTSCQYVSVMSSMGTWVGTPTLFTRTSTPTIGLVCRPEKLNDLVLSRNVGRHRQGRAARTTNSGRHSLEHLGSARRQNRVCTGGRQCFRNSTSDSVACAGDDSHSIR